MKSTCPDLGLGDCKMDRTRVDLPEPDSPTTPSASPSRTSSDTPEQACTVPRPGRRNSCTTSRTRSTGVPPSPAAAAPLALASVTTALAVSPARSLDHLLHGRFLFLRGRLLG